LRESVGQGDDLAVSERRTAPPECRAKSPNQSLAVEGHSSRDQRSVAEILHATVGNSEVDHRFHFLGDHGFRGIRQNPRRRHAVKKRGELEIRRFRRHDVSKSDVDLHWDAGSGEMSTQVRAKTAVSVLFPNRVDVQRVYVEDETIIFDMRADDFANRRIDGAFVGLTHAKQVEIARGAIGFADTHGQQHRAFEHEAIAVRRARQSVEKAFGGEVDQRQREVFPPVLAHVQQSRPDRRWNVDQ